MVTVCLVYGESNRFWWLVVLLVECKFFVIWGVGWLSGVWLLAVDVNSVFDVLLSWVVWLLTLFAIVT